MQEAGFITFLRTIAIILLVIYGLKFIAKYVFPLLVKSAIQKAQKRAQEQRGYRESPDVKVGETTIDKKPNNQSNTNNNIGEYVDYEEIE